MDSRSTDSPDSPTVDGVTRELDDVFRDVFRGSAAVEAGVLTRGRLRGPEFQRLFRDVYVRASVKVTHELRCRAASLALPDGVAITGRSAATVRGVRIAWPEDPVQILATPATRLGRRKGIDARRTVIDPGDAEPWAYGLLASPMRLTLDLLLDSPVPEAVAGLDAVLRAGLVDREHIAAQRALRGRARAFAASTSRSFGGAVVTSSSSSRRVAAAISPTARSNAFSLACDGRAEPLSLRTYCSAASCTSASGAGGAKLCSGRMLRHMRPRYLWATGGV